MKTDVLVVGAGFAGSVVAERLTRVGRRVHVADEPPHVAGNVDDDPVVIAAAEALGWNPPASVAPAHATRPDPTPTLESRPVAPLTIEVI